jgi:hypothetical protein
MLNKKTLLSVTAGLCLLSTGAGAESTGLTRTINQGTTETLSILIASDTFYAASSDRTVCQVAFEEASNVETLIYVTGVSPGRCTTFYFNNNVLEGSRDFEVVSHSENEYTIVPCYEFYQQEYVDHFYTIDEKLKHSLMNELKHYGYTYSGIAFYVYKKNN